MTSIRKRMGVLFLGTAIPLVLASAAYACASLATLSINPEKGRPGITVAGTGANYCSDPACSEVTIHFKSRSGPVLATTRPGADRRIAFEFKVPKAAAGWYSIVAVQSKADGSPVAGTPGRDSFKVVRRSSANNGGTAPVWFSNQSPPSESPAPSGLELPVSTSALFALALAGFGLTLGLGVYWKLTGRLNAAVSA